MTGPIAYARAALKKDLERIQSLPVHVNIPELINPPCLFITEGTPLLETNSVHFGGLTVTLTVTAVIAPTTNALAISRMDEAVDALITGLMDEWPLIEVDTYTTVTAADNQKYLAAKFDVSQPLQYLKDEEE